MANIIKTSDGLKEQLEYYISSELATNYPEATSLESNTNLAKNITKKLLEMSSNALLRERLEILHEYEKHYLDLIKDYKEEIKFAAALQEDIRKERAKFFSETLKDVSSTLKSTEADKEVIKEWTRDLVSSYTKSLDVTSKLASEQVQEIFTSIQEESKDTIKKATKTENID